jgi:hypothetical protein
MQLMAFLRRMEVCEDCYGGIQSSVMQFPKFEVMFPYIGLSLTGDTSTLLPLSGIGERCKCLVLVSEGLPPSV